MEVLMKIPVWNIEKETGYRPKTTFWQDFSIADCFGRGAVEDTFRRAFNEWKDDYMYLTELVMVLNHKIVQWQGKDLPLTEFYNEAWNMADSYAVDNLKGEKLDYFYQTTD